jgi:catechol 2,3-dioxygenase-like lactoylglutathione lyase family enzyme
MSTTTSADVFRSIIVPTLFTPAYLFYIIKQIRNLTAGGVDVINYLTIGTNRFDEAVAFYDALMADMGATRAYATERTVGWGWGIGTPMFIVIRPFDQRQATVANGSMVAFDVETPERVDVLHARVLALGGTSEGDPGPRGEHLYAAYWRDLDGNKCNFICYKQKAGA